MQASIEPRLTGTAELWFAERRIRKLRRERQKLEAERKRLERAKAPAPNDRKPNWNDTIKDLVARLGPEDVPYAVILVIAGQFLVVSLPDIIKPYLAAKSDALPVALLPFTGLLLWVVLAGIVIRIIGRR